MASSPVPFNADIGTDTGGRPELIYQRCAGSTNPGYQIVQPGPTGCDLFVYSLADATGERPVRNANDPAHNDVDPTLWHGRIAWTREYGSGQHANPIVYTKLLSAPRSQPSTQGLARWTLASGPVLRVLQGGIGLVDASMRLPSRRRRRSRPSPSSEPGVGDSR